MTNVAELQNLPRWRRVLLLFASFLGLFSGLCTIFALTVTAAEGWQEHAHSHWPEAAAQIQRCGLDIYMHKPESYWIDCSMSYTVHGQEIVSHVHSRTIPAPRRMVWQYPKHFDRMREWVDEHPQGTPIRVRYDPAHPSKAVLVTTDMPLGGPRTPDNLKLVGICVASCVVLSTIARITRPKDALLNH